MITGELIKIKVKKSIKNKYKKFELKNKTCCASKYISYYLMLVCSDQQLTKDQKVEKWLYFENFLLKKESNGSYWNQITDILDVITMDFIIQSSEKSKRFKEGSEAMDKFHQSTVNKVIECPFGNTQSKLAKLLKINPGKCECR